MKAALIVPPNLSGKPLKVVTRYFEGGSHGPCKPLRGKEYDDNTPILILMKDIIEALGGTYTELDSELEFENTNIDLANGIIQTQLINQNSTPLTSGIIQLDLNLTHVSLRYIRRSLVEGHMDSATTTTNSNVVILPLTTRQFDITDNNGTDLYELEFYPDEGYTIDSVTSNAGYNITNLKQRISNLIENENWPATSYNMSFGYQLKLTWLPQNLTTLTINVNAIQI